MSQNHHLQGGGCRADFIFVKFFLAESQFKFQSKPDQFQFIRALQWTFLIKFPQ